MVTANGTRWITGVSGAVVGGIVLTWILTIQADVTTLKIEVAASKAAVATAAEVAAIRGQVNVLNERIDVANATLLRLESLQGKK